MSSSLPASTIWCVMSTSSLLGVGSPEGWLWTTIKAALRYNSAAIIVVHNHPSTDATPSPEDVLVTREIVAAGKLLDVEVLDRAP